MGIHVQQKGDVMVPTSDVWGVARLVQVVVTTTAAAKNYSNDWPTSALSVLAQVRGEFSATFMRTFCKTFIEIDETKEWADVPGLRNERGILIKGRWSMSFLLPGTHIICLRRSDREFVTINLETHVVESGDEWLAKVIGGPDYPGNMALFIDACAYAREELFRRRRAQLDALEEGCMLRPMSEVFDPRQGEAVDTILADIKK